MRIGDIGIPAAWTGAIKQIAGFGNTLSLWDYVKDSGVMGRFPIKFYSYPLSLHSKTNFMKSGTTVISNQHDRSMVVRTANETTAVCNYFVDDESHQGHYKIADLTIIKEPVEAAI